MEKRKFQYDCRLKKKNLQKPQNNQNSTQMFYFTIDEFSIELSKFLLLRVFMCLMMIDDPVVSFHFLASTRF